VSVISFEGDPEQGGIPDEAHVRIETCYGKIKGEKNKGVRGHRSLKAKHREVMFSGKVTGGSIGINLDPGLYSYKVRFSPEDGIGQTLYGGYFYHQVTPEQHQKITHMKPNMSKATMTTEGVRFECLFPGCKKKTTSRVAALLHESSIHYGVDLLADPEKKTQIDAEYKDSQQQVRRRPGRPKGSRTGMGLGSS